MSVAPANRRYRVWYRPMTSRDRDERHRAATPLELLFDLCFVVAVGQAASELHHQLSENHVAHGVLSFLLVFFAIWWGWVNFTWFASAFDTDDGPYRLLTLVQIGGALVVAAGVGKAFGDDFTVIVIGYVLMRLAMVGQWLRAAGSVPERRRTALRYAAGIAIVQVAWIARLALPRSWLLPAFLVLAVAELLVPVWAEWRAETSWHRHHIAERYGLFTLIVLGETVFSATNAVRDAIDSGSDVIDFVFVALAGLLLVFSMWWLYFDQPGHQRLAQFRLGYTWGYGHYLIFASAAAVGVGIEVALDHQTHTGHAPELAAAFATTLPVAVFVLSVWLLHVGPRNECRPIAIGFPLAAVLVLAVSFTPAPVYLTALIMVALVATRVIASHGEPVKTTLGD
ncbi:low temperature requirement protein A [Amycolatopsis thermophila]|uniref:Low temperature requirement protein LtrA n=1 Tax=Amycolatopsis thermophila TaxID=206084 RepID=A0ABU0EXZ7_9PSEU|nr:low temperature requirement protein A [Amycolatopsis thermophila]MDQ0379836.1 low temperature requirement protein LtrA [Amycolatopsis thermophila]